MNSPSNKSLGPGPLQGVLDGVGEVLESENGDGILRRLELIPCFGGAGGGWNQDKT